MKKSILNLGRALNRKAQKNVFGGSIYPTMYDERCDELPEGVRVAGCPCSQDSQCINMGVSFEALGSQHPGGYTLRPGSCVAGACEVNTN